MRKGFTLVELLVVMGITVALGIVIFASLATRRSDADLTAATQQIATLLRQAQSDAMAQEDDVSWGVHFSNATSSAPFYALFTGSYSPSSTVGYYPLPSTVAYQTSTLASGASIDVIFSSITGGSSVSTTIGLYMPKGGGVSSSTISIASSGAVSY